jgi:hypothetical protein
VCLYKWVYITKAWWPNYLMTLSLKHTLTQTHSNTVTQTLSLKHSHSEPLTQTLSLRHSHSDTLTQTHSLGHSHSCTLTQTLSLKHSHLDTLTHTLSLRHSHSYTPTQTLSLGHSHSDTLAHTLSLGHSHLDALTLLLLHLWYITWPRLPLGCIRHRRVTTCTTHLCTTYHLFPRCSIHCFVIPVFSSCPLRWLAPYITLLVIYFPVSINRNK